MKKIILFAVLLSSFACAKIDGGPQETSGKAIVVNLQDLTSKAGIDGLDVNWKSGDILWFCETATDMKTYTGVNVKYVLTAGAGTKSGTFEPANSANVLQNGSTYQAVNVRDDSQILLPNVATGMKATNAQIGMILMRKGSTAMEVINDAGMDYVDNASVYVGTPAVYQSAAPLSLAMNPIVSYFEFRVNIDPTNTGSSIDFTKITVTGTDVLFMAAIKFKYNLPSFSKLASADADNVSSVTGDRAGAAISVNFTATKTTPAVVRLPFIPYRLTSDGVYQVTLTTAGGDNLEYVFTAPANLDLTSTARGRVFPVKIMAKL